ncbi:MAG: hypothetical protein ACRC67_18160 [Inquilinus sp.]|uniref:hypothetical protein n=1 Tax=Inquilinus sp. TaxID=1932117 RepID=UPI003F2FB42C
MGEKTTTLSFPLGFGQHVEVKNLGISGTVEGLYQRSDGRQDALLRYASQDAQILETWIPVGDLVPSESFPG